MSAVIPPAQAEAPALHLSTPPLLHAPAPRPPPCRYQLNFTQELRGLGYANIAGAMFNCYTTTGSFSRSAVNNSVG